MLNATHKVLDENTSSEKTFLNSENSQILLSYKY